MLMHSVRVVQRDGFWKGKGTDMRAGLKSSFWHQKSTGEGSSQTAEFIITDTNDYA